MTIIDSGPQWIDLEGAVNARSLVSGVLLRSDNLQSLTERDLRVLIDQERLEVVIDLRTDIEVRLEGPGPLTRQPGVRIEHRSLYPDSVANTDVELETLRPWQQIEEHDLVDEPPAVQAYVSYLRRRPDSIVASIRTIAHADGAVLVHCAAGKDRTGVVVALALDAVGVPRSDVVADYVATRERIEAIIERLRGSATYRAELAGQPASALAPAAETMERFLDVVDRRLGGSARWLGESGLERADLERLHDRLGASESRRFAPG
ncbi:MAG: tyrosine-protein phosphatase [Solirubrobacteraceae bacterium]